MKKNEKSKNKAAFNSLLKLNKKGKFSDFVFDLEDKRGRIKIYQGYDFVITESKFNTASRTLPWNHLNEAGFVEFNFILNGSLYQSQKGLFENQLYSEGYHNWLFNPEGIEENHLIGNGDYQLICIYLQVPKFLSLLSEYTSNFRQLINYTNNSKAWCKHSPQPAFSKKLLYFLKNLWDYPSEKKLQPLYFESTIHQIFCEQSTILFYNKIQNEEMVLKKEDIEKLHEVAHTLSKSYLNPPLSKELALQCGLNECKLKKGFKQLYGTTTMGYIKNVRMSLAKELISNSEKTISEIAFELGYAHSQHFHRVFKKEFGVVPTVFRK